MEQEDFARCTSPIDAGMLTRERVPELGRGPENLPLETHVTRLEHVATRVTTRSRPTSLLIPSERGRFGTSKSKQITSRSGSTLSLSCI